MAEGGFDGIWQGHAENLGKRYFRTFMKIIGGEVSQGATSQGPVRDPISLGPIYRFCVRSSEARELNESSISDAAISRWRRRILSPELSYVGCDIVPGLTARNSAQYANERIEFRFLDIVTDPLPEGDLCIIRQVFQHLSNGDIATVLRKARQYSLLVVTDELVVGDHSDGNIDIVPYHGTRRLFGRGLKLEAAPFFERVEILLEHSSGSEYAATSDTYLRTVLIRNNSRRNARSEN